MDLLGPTCFLGLLGLDAEPVLVRLDRVLTFFKVGDWCKDELLDKFPSSLPAFDLA